MIVVNMFGGPGCGKSTTAAGLFYALKLLGVNVELVTEYAKDLTWEDRTSALTNQTLILGEQYQRIKRLDGKVSVVITDAPLLLTCLYNKTSRHLNDVAVELHNSFRSMNYLLHREKKYVKIGRKQTESEAIFLDSETRKILEHYNIEYSEMPGTDDGVQKLVEIVVAALNAC